MSVIGELRNAGTLERAAVARLKERMNAYLADAAAQNDVDYEPAQLRGVIRASELVDWPEDQKPVAVVVSPGTTGDEPAPDGAGYYTATYSLAVAVIVAGQDNDSSRDLAQLYGAATRGALLQGRSWRNVARHVAWRGESFDDLSPDPRRTLFGVLNVFWVQVDNVVSWKEGPLVDPDGDWPDPVPDAWPTVLTHEESADLMP